MAGLNNGERLSSTTSGAGRKSLPPTAYKSGSARSIDSKSSLKNPLDTAYWFYMDEEGVQAYAEQSYEFLRQVYEYEPGTLLYIGGVIDYHF